MDEQIELREFIQQQYDRIEAYIEQSSDVDYFKTIGLSLTIFTIFEYSMGEIFDDFREYVLGRQEDGVSKLKRLPLRALSKILADEDGKSFFPISGLLSYLQKEGPISLPEGKEKPKDLNTRIFNNLKSYYSFTHFNTEKSGKTSIEKIDDMFFNKTFLEDYSRNKFFVNLEIEIDDLGLGFSNMRVEKATDYINNYSEKVRHIIAHKLPFQDGESGIDEAFFRNLSDYSPKQASKIFKYILLKLYDEYERLHGHKIFIHDQIVSGQEFSFASDQIISGQEFIFDNN